MSFSKVSIIFSTETDILEDIDIDNTFPKFCYIKFEGKEYKLHPNYDYLDEDMIMEYCMDEEIPYDKKKKLYNIKFCVFYNVEEEKLLHIKSYYETSKIFTPKSVCYNGFDSDEEPLVKLKQK
jgi:hypothetical protein